MQEQERMGTDPRQILVTQVPRLSGEGATKVTKIKQCRQLCANVGPECVGWMVREQGQEQIRKEMEIRKETQRKRERFQGKIRVFTRAESVKSGPTKE